MSALEGGSVSPGDILAGKYQVERVVGVGGMGIVAAARHLDLDEVFAIKLMHAEGLEDEKATERFLREARACARLRGEHVARVHDVGRLEDGAPYMVMEYLEGTDLRRIVKTQGALPLDHVVDYVIQTCEAIAEAHALGIIHRDIKPGNLFLTRRANGTACIKVLDFGISKQLGPDGGLDVTKTQDMLGSPLYMSPEQMRSGKVADPRSDIWSLGVVLYELASGVVPFAGNSVTEVCARVVQDPPPPFIGRVPGTTAAFERIVLRCLEKDPANRYQTVSELAEALRALDQETEDPPTTILRPDAPVLLPSPAPVLLPSPVPAGEPKSAIDISASASWGSTAAPVTPRLSSLRLVVGACIGVVIGALCVAGIFLARAPKPEPAAASSAALPLAASLEPPASAAALIASASPLPSAAQAVASSAPDLGAADPEPAKSSSRASGGKVKQVQKAASGGKRPAVIDYGDRQ